MEGTYFMMKEYSTYNNSLVKVGMFACLISQDQGNHKVDLFLWVIENQKI